eukprot:scaffold21889_cov25-Prasinocladus_malaysianus.AAC.1
MACHVGSFEAPCCSNVGIAVRNCIPWPLTGSQRGHDVRYPYSYEYLDGRYVCIYSLAKTLQSLVDGCAAFDNPHELDPHKATIEPRFQGVAVATTP